MAKSCPIMKHDMH